MGKFNFIGGTEKSLAKKPFMVMDYNTVRSLSNLGTSLGATAEASSNLQTEGGTGHPGFICHRQPVLEKHLRRSMAENGHSDLRVQSTVLSISEDEDWVYVKYMDKDGRERRLRGRFLVGADGKTGFTRKRYLEPQGILMDKAHQEVAVIPSAVVLG